MKSLEWIKVNGICLLMWLVIWFVYDVVRAMLGWPDLVIWQEISLVVVGITGSAINRGILDKHEA